MSILIFHPHAVVFMGPLEHVDAHRHAAPAMVLGRERPIDFQIESTGATLRLELGCIPPGLTHALDVNGEALVVYLEPGSTWATNALRRCAPDTIVAGERLAGWHALADALVEAGNCPGAISDALEPALDTLLGDGAPRAALDARVAQLLRQCRSEGAEARLPGLSQSRMSHLFTEDTGTSLRHYKVWRRLQTAVGRILAGESMTTAALDAGFFDSSHFSRAFRAMFGVSPSAVIVRGQLQHVFLSAAWARSSFEDTTTRPTTFLPLRA